MSGNLLVAVGRECGLAESDPLLAAFMPFYEQASPLVAQAATVNVTALDQVTEMRKSREIRLKLRPIRIAADKKRKELKEDSLKRSANIETLAQAVIKAIDAEENRLADQERFAERAEQSRKLELLRSRTTLLSPYLSDMTGYDLANMPQATFDVLLTNTRAAHEARAAAAQKAEEERRAAETARVDEEKRVRADNERLRLEAQAKELEAAAERRRLTAERQAVEEAARQERLAAQARADVARQRAEAEAREAAEVARKEREAVEKKAAEERAAREKAEAELREKKAQDDRRARAEAEAKKKAERAPDKEKILAISAAIRGLPMPAVKSNEANDVLAEVIERLAATTASIDKLASTL